MIPRGSPRFAWKSAGTLGVSVDRTQREDEKMNVFNFRSLREPMIVVGFFSNPWLLLAWTVTVGLQVCAVYVPFLQQALHTVPLGWADWGLMLVVAAPIFLITETVKWYRRRWNTPEKEVVPGAYARRWP